MESSSFNQLPAEIRNAIYAYTLFEQDDVNINSNEPALLKTCKQIRGEASLMFWAMNSFKVHIHEENSKHGLCQWLTEAGPRLQLVRSLALHIEMPSVGSETEAADDEARDANSKGMFYLWHIVDSLREADWGRQHIETVVRFTVNDACDSEKFEKIDLMSTPDQDRFLGSKFFLLCLVHGAVETAEAMETDDSLDRLMMTDETIQRRRSLHLMSESVGVHRDGRTTVKL